MSHTVTVTRTTTTATTSALLINTGYLRTIPGILKFFETIIGAVCVGLIANYSYYTIHRYQNYNTDIFFLIVTSAFLICTFAILVSCIISISTASILPKTIFELIYHGLAFVLYIIASICLIVEVNRYRHSRYEYDPLLAASILGLINSGLYLLSTGFAYKSYRGG